MGILRIISNGTGSGWSSDSKGTTKYRQELTDLLSLPAHGFIHDYYEMQDAIKILEQRFVEEKSKTTRELLKKVIEHLKIVHANGKSPARMPIRTE